LRFRGHGVFDVVEMLLENQGHRSSKTRVAIERTSLMFTNAFL
jgi:hypothetical protein